MKTAEVVERLVKEGVRVDERRGDGMTPLMVAAEEGNFEVTQELLNHRANTDLQDRVSAGKERVMECGKESMN